MIAFGSGASAPSLDASSRAGGATRARRGAVAVESDSTRSAEALSREGGAALAFGVEPAGSFWETRLSPTGLSLSSATPGGIDDLVESGAADAGKVSPVSRRIVAGASVWASRAGTGWRTPASPSPPDGRSPPRELFGASGTGSCRRSSRP